jgi:hypothetical protein
MHSLSFDHELFATRQHSGIATAVELNGTRGVVGKGKAALGLVVVKLAGEKTPKAFPFERLVRIR